MSSVSVETPAGEARFRPQGSGRTVSPAGGKPEGPRGNPNAGDSAQTPRGEDPDQRGLEPKASSSRGNAADRRATRVPRISVALGEMASRSSFFLGFHFKSSLFSYDIDFASFASHAGRKKKQ